MQYGDPDLDWTEWVAANEDRDEATKLEALREYIFEVAKRWLGTCSYDAGWANKKLAKLGITQRIDQVSTYRLEAIGTGVVSTTISARTRAEAVERFRDWVNAAPSVSIARGSSVSTPAITSGPEDPDKLVIPADAPATVTDLLAAFREVILLGHIAGPHMCEYESNKVLAAFGLSPIPAKQQFVVTRPVEAVMRTVVEAYDEASAARVAGWRWEDGRSGYEVSEATATDAPTVDVN